MANSPESIRPLQATVLITDVGHRQMVGVNLHEWFVEFSVALDNALPEEHYPTPSPYDYYFHTVIGLLMIDVVKRNAHIGDYTGLSELTVLLNGEAHVNEFLASLIEAGTLGGTIMCGLKNSLDVKHPYVITEGTLYYITQ